MSISDIKKEFPIFSNKIHNNDLVYLDSANSSQKPQSVIDRVNEFYTNEFSNTGRSVHYLADNHQFFGQMDQQKFYPGKHLLNYH